MNAIEQCDYGDSQEWNAFVRSNVIDTAAIVNTTLRTMNRGDPLLKGFEIHRTSTMSSENGTDESRISDRSFASIDCRTDMVNCSRDGLSGF